MPRPDPHHPLPRAVNVGCCRPIAAPFPRESPLADQKPPGHYIPKGWPAADDGVVHSYEGPPPRVQVEQLCGAIHTPGSPWDQAEVRLEPKTTLLGFFTRPILLPPLPYQFPSRGFSHNTSSAQKPRSQTLPLRNPPARISTRQS